MIFVVRRTSNWDHEEPPCPEAFVVMGHYVDEKTVDHPDKNKYIGSKEWYSRGINHRVENGKIKRDLPTECWAVKIADLAALLAFSEKYGEIVVKAKDDRTMKDVPSIEIYDDYRE